MTKPKSISDVKDVQDLYALYAERDLDADGKLGPGEVSPEEIHEGDVVLGGNGDGYLSPWEVMQMRSGCFGKRKTAMTLYANEVLGRVSLDDRGASSTRDGRPICGSMKCFRELFPNIKLLGTSEPDVIKSVIAQLGKLSPKLLSSIRVIRFARWRDAASLGYGAPQPSNAFTVFSRREIVFFKDFVSEPSERLMQHEAAHLLTRASGRQFRREWKKAAGDVYGDKYCDYEITSKKLRRMVWRDAKGDGPRYGIVRARAASNWREDVSGIVDMATTEPGYYRSLLDPTSDYYSYYPDQRRYASVYREKLELIRKYGFITDEIYAEITAPIMEYENDASLEAIAEAILKYDSPSAYRHSEKVLRKACMKASDPAVADRLFRSLLKLGAFEEAEQVMTYLLWEENVDKRETLTDTVTDFLFDYSGKQPIQESLTTAMLKLLNA